MRRLDKGTDKDNKGVSALGKWVYVTVSAIQGQIGITSVDRVDAVRGVILGYVCLTELLAPRSRDLVSPIGDNEVGVARCVTEGLFLLKIPFLSQTNLFFCFRRHFCKYLKQG